MYIYIRRRKWQPTPVFLPGKFHGQRGLEGYSPCSHRRVRHNLATKQQMSNFWYNILDAAKDTSYNFPFMTWYDTIMTTLWQKPRAELHNPKEVPKSRAPNLYLVHVVIPSKSDLTGRNMKTDPSWALDEVPTGSIKGKFESFGFADLIIRTKTAQVRLELKQAGTSWQSSGSYLQPFLRANDIQHLNSTCCLFSTDSFSNCASYDFLQSES